MQGLVWVKENIEINGRRYNWRHISDQQDKSSLICEF